MSMDEMPNYDEEAVRPMREELMRVGFEEARTPEEVDAAFAPEAGVTLVVINSVCGCAAGGARPGVALALQHERIPDRLVTSFAGQDKAAVRRIREHLSAYPPSSPFIALVKGTEALFVMQRHDIEGKDPQTIAAELRRAFDAHCSRPGPSIPREEFERLENVQICGSQIPPSTVQIEGLGPSDAGAGEESEREGRRRAWWRLFG